MRDGTRSSSTKLDWLARSTAHVARRVPDLHELGVTLRSLMETIDTSSAAGRLMVHVLADVKQMAANPTRECTLDDLAAAQVELAGGQSRNAVARTLGVSRDPLDRHLAGAQGVSASGRGQDHSASSAAR
ncbi:recombinase family protein [Cellulosimicrobium cellulans]|uniref:recombinase family protein n=1 Tax=Cellulosimicrobium cellulans TaxID=1710 RepID=UPI0036E2E78B